MSSVNRVIITGHLTRDPEVKYLPSGTAVAKLGVAVNSRYKDKSGEWKDDTCFIDVDVWGKRAEWIERDCRKGSKVLVEGSLREDNWEDREGNRRSKIKVKAFHAEHIGEPRGGGGGQSEPRGSSAPSGAPSGPPDSPPDETDDDLPF